MSFRKRTAIHSSSGLERLGSTITAFPGGNAFAWPTAETRSWHMPLDEWLANLGQHVFARVPFALGLIGFEVWDGSDRAELLQGGPPLVRTKGYLWPRGAELQWFPVTEWPTSRDRR